MAADVVQLDGKSVKTSRGARRRSSVGGNVMINNATVTTADIACTNGVIHVIDTVVLPKSGDRRHHTQQDRRV